MSTKKQYWNKIKKRECVQCPEKPLRKLNVCLNCQEKKASWNRNWRKNNRLYMVIWLNNHPNYMKKYLKKWYEKNPNYLKDYYQKHRRR